MEVTVHSPVNPADEPRFLIDWQDQQDRSRTGRAGVVSLAAHLAALLLLSFLPRTVVYHPEHRPTRTITPLTAPLTELTQTVPNKGKISKEFNAESLQPRPRIQIPPSRPSSTRPAAPQLAMPTQPKTPAPPAAMPEPPKIESAGREPQAPNVGPDPNQLARMAPPQIQAQEKPVEKPKLAFENPQPAQEGGGRGTGQLAPPSSSVSEAVRSVARGGGGGGLVVGDLGTGDGSLGEAMNLPPSPGKTGSALELLSDPQGVDFRPYLIKILANVRRNWFAVMPESAKLGRRGKVAIQFAIARNGSVPKLVIVLPSGTDALDRAAVAGISASNPFPPLPTEFRGDQVRLQFTFGYNMPSK
jgi:TonB family protein